MIPRYEHPTIREIFSEAEKLRGWDETELAVICARAELGLGSQEAYEASKAELAKNPPDIEWWKKREIEISHDLNAYLDERRRHISVEHQAEFHKNMTSYDTEEPAQARTLIKASAVVNKAIDTLLEVMKRRALEHRYTVMLARTHGQGAKLQSFGKRILTWYEELRIAQSQVQSAALFCRKSRISGAVGNYGGGLTPEIEELALAHLGLDVFVGATQITPRVLYTPLAQSLQLVCNTLGKAALDIRLGARSGFPIYQEPFGKKQKGSSAMPHKKNTIQTEQIEGMVRLVNAAVEALIACMITWEERSIEQSSVERVAWPDLFHETMRVLAVMTKVIDGLVIYPDHMLREIVESQGTYASDEAKNFLAAQCSKRGMEAEIAYRIIQLASFCVFKPQETWTNARTRVARDLEETGALLSVAISAPLPILVDISDFVRSARLSPVDELGATTEMIAEWNSLLSDIFSDTKVAEEWEALSSHHFFFVRKRACSGESLICSGCYLDRPEFFRDGFSYLV